MMMETFLMGKFKSLDRAFFLPKAWKGEATLDKPLPIGLGQTISQPSLVLKMTALLQVDKEHRVLEIGTGSGYQTALLSLVAKEVYTVERLSALQKEARERLEELGMANIQYQVADGTYGWPEKGPYDRIMFTAAGRRIPKALVAQLKPQGKMVLPVGEKGLQKLFLVEKSHGEVFITEHAYVRFVELVGEDGF